MSDSESDLDIPDLPSLPQFPIAGQESLETLQRKEIDALRVQVLERASENSILAARIRDIDEIFSRRLGEQVTALTASREAQVAEVEAAKREFAVLQRRYSFLERENKTLAAKSESSGSKGRHNSLGDGFVVKRRKPDPEESVDVPLDQQFRDKLAGCKLPNGNSALLQLGTETVGIIMSFHTADSTANYLIECLVRFDVFLLPACLKLLSVIVEHTQISDLNFSSLVNAIFLLLKEIKPFPSVDEPGNLYIDRRVCYSLTSLLYALDFLIYCSRPAPQPLVEQLLRNVNPLVSIRGFMLLQLSPREITEKNIMTDTSGTLFIPSVQLLFGGLWDPWPLDATDIPEYSRLLLHIQWPKRQIKIVCNELSRALKQEFNFQMVRAISVKQTLEPKMWYKVISILLNTEDYDSKLAKTCVRFIWQRSPMPSDFESKLYATLLTTKLSRVASLTDDPDTSYWCQEILRQIISPQEDEILREMMNY